MRSQEYIVSNAMLAAYLGKASTDCLDLMKPFVLYLLPELDRKVDINEISIGIKRDFGFKEVPNNVILKIIKRIEKKDSYIKKNDGVYYVSREYDKTSFEQNRRIITSKISNLAEKLAKFIKDARYNLFVSNEQAREYIQTFLESYNYLYNEIDKYKNITISSSNSKSNFWVARFLLSEYEKESVLFDDFLEIVKGSLASRAITFLAEEKTEESKKLQDTVFYFDTRLLINCLGISSEEEYRATTELKELIEKNGGKVRTFTNYQEELHGILTKYIKSPVDRVNLSLDYFRENQFSMDFVRTYRDSLESHLEEIGILVDKRPDCSEPIEKLDWPIDILELKNTLSEYVNYSKDDKGEVALNNDVETLESISILRYNLKGKCSLEDCKAIFVTQNNDITYAAHQYFKGITSARGIELAVSEVELTAWLWVNYGRNSNDLPKMKLLENAYTACCPTEDVINEFSRIVVAMREKGMITTQQANIIRQGNIDLTTLIDKSNNDSTKIEENDVQELVNKYFGDIERKVKKKFQGDFYNLGKERQKFQNEKDKKVRQLDKRESEISTKERHIVNLEEEQKKKIIKYRNSVMDGQMKKADDDAKRVQKKVLFWGNLLVGIIFLGLIVFSGYGFFSSVQSFKNTNFLWFCSNIVFALLGLIGVIDVVRGIKNGGTRLVYYISTKVYSNKYEKYLEENKKYIPE